MSVQVASAADGADWEARLLAAPGPITITRRCVDIVELVAVAGSGQTAAVLVDAQLRRLDADAVERLAAAGVAVIGVTATEFDVDRLVECGIEFSVPADADPAVFRTVVETALGAPSADADTASRTFGDPAAALGALGSALGSPGPSLAAVPEQPSRGSVIAVWGPAGAPGRSTVATNIADELARLGLPTLLVDADVYGGVLANVLGLLDESPGLVAACRQAQSRRLDGTALSALCWQINAKLRVLTGIPRPDRWPELRPSAVANVLEVSRQLAEFTVLDLGFSLETDEELSFDTIAPRRNGATLAALDAADLVLVVGSADPVGMQRLVRGLDELRAAEIDKPTWIVLNRVRASAVPGDPASELDATLRRFAGRAPAALLPYDIEALDRAIVAGQTLAELTPNSPLRRAILDLAATIAGVPAPQRGRRRR